MPAHITHVLFAEDVLRQATANADAILERAGNLFRLGAQGPDLFYHNQRTRPLGLRYGTLLHRRGYGTVIAQMAQLLLAAAARDGALDQEAAAYLLGFATHAELDRHTHPYIICRGGWVRSGDDASRVYFRCHTFLERMLDVVALRELRGAELHQFDFFSQIYCGERLPYATLKMLLKAIDAGYPDARYKSRNRRRIENAYVDSMRFYTLTDHRNPQLRRRALQLDRSEGFRRRRVAVYHFPDHGQELDPGNLRRRPWPHPCAPELRSTDSFLDRMTAARTVLVPRLRTLAATIGLRFDPPAGAIAPTELAPLFGDQGLGATLDGATCTPVHAEPLPLPDVFERLYAESA